MELPLVDIIIVVAYLCALLVFGLWFRKFVKTEKDYFLAGRSLPFWAIGMSIVVSDIGAIDFVSLSGEGYRTGVAAANMDWIGTIPAVFIAAFIFIPYFWRSGVYSVPEYLGRRYDGRVQWIQSIAWSLFLVFNLGAIFWATAEMFETLIGPVFWEFLVPAENQNTRLMLYVVIAAAFTGAYTVSGGLAAVVYTDVVQLVIMFLGAGIIVYLGLERVGGWGELKSSIEAAGHTEHFHLFLPHDTKTPFPWTGVLFGLALVQAPAYFIGNQAIVQRTLGARDEWSAKAGTLFAGFLKLFIPVLVVLPGLLSLQMYPDLEKTDTAFAILVSELLPAGLRGIVFAGFLAAMMSSVDSILTSAATLITRDIILKARSSKEPLDGKKLLKLGRGVTIVLLLFGVASAPTMSQDLKIFQGIYGAIQNVLSIIQGPTWALLLLGIFWRRASPTGGFIGVCIGLAVSTGLTIWNKVAAEDAKPFTSEDPFMFIAAISFVATMVAISLVSLRTRPRSPDELRGLVYRESSRGQEAQDALRRRAENSDENGDAE